MRPYELLPLPFPASYNPGGLFFYDNFVKPLIPDMIRMMDEGIDIDDEAVEALRKTIDEVLITVDKRLAGNKIISRFKKHQLPAAQKAYADKCTEAVRTVDHYLKPFKGTDILHRTWVVNTYLSNNNLEKDIKPKWSVSDLKKYNAWLKCPLFTRIIDKHNVSDCKDTLRGMKALAKYKLELWNRPRYDKAALPAPVEPFNAGSPKQKKELFELLNIGALAFSKDTGEASWGREQLEELLLVYSDDKELVEVLEAFIDHSYSAIIRNNFLKAFDSYTIDGVLHGNIKLFGAKSFRPTSNSPNLLNAPSSGSIYAKPLKRCFVAPDGHVIYAVDLSALEDRVVANLSGDENKQSIFLNNLDGHSLNSCVYFAKKIEKFMGPNTDNIPYIREFYRLVDEEKHPELWKIRFDSKAPTFKLAYGGFPDAHKPGGVITQEIFDNYHNVLYPGIRDYTNNYVLPTAHRQGYIHLGLGCIMYTSDPEADIRTLNNATVQFWSILTLIALNEFNYRIDQAGLQKEVRPSSTIYDSIYTKVVSDPHVLRWVNNNLVEILCVQYLEEQAIPNEAAGEIGLNWADMHKIENNASVKNIAEILKTVTESK